MRSQNRRTNERAAIFTRPIFQTPIRCNKRRNNLIATSVLGNRRQRDNPVSNGGGIGGRDQTPDPRRGRSKTRRGFGGFGNGNAGTRPRLRLSGDARLRRGTIEQRCQMKDKICGTKMEIILNFNFQFIFFN